MSKSETEIIVLALQYHCAWTINDNTTTAYIKCSATINTATCADAVVCDSGGGGAHSITIPW